MEQRRKVLASLGLRVRRRRELLNLTQETLSERSELDQTYISGIERGLRNPGILNVANWQRLWDLPLPSFVREWISKSHYWHVLTLLAFDACILPLEPWGVFV
jgi:transcriptional regulator with XRE-family HTH domain